MNTYREIKFLRGGRNGKGGNHNFHRMHFVLVLALILTAFNSNGQLVVESGNVQYRVLTAWPKSLEVTGFVDGAENVDSLIIPDKVPYLNGTLYDVIGVAEKAFKGNASITYVELPGSITYVEDEAFYGCKSLKKAVISGKLKNIGKGAFQGCSYLKSVQFLDECKTFGSSIFANCVSLEEIVMPKNLELIPEKAFFACTGLQKISLPEGIREIQINAFRETGIVTLKIPDTVEHIDNYVFYNCKFLKSINIPKSAELALFKNIFVGCSNLTSIKVSEENPYYSSEGGILYDKEKTIIYAYPTASGDLEIQKSVKKIDYNSFAECSELESVVIPSTIKTVCGFSFVNCYKLSRVVCLAETPPSSGAFAFCEDTFSSLTFSNCPIYVPDNSLLLYQGDEYWSCYNLLPLSSLAGIGTPGAEQSEDAHIVYSLDGRIAAKTDDPEKLNSLQRGVYIVNGKKVILGK